MKIEIDKEALRFEFKDGGLNLFWKDLFLGIDHGMEFQKEVMNALFKAYNECVRDDIQPNLEENEAGE